MKLSQPISVSLFISLFITLFVPIFTTFVSATFFHLQHHHGLQRRNQLHSRDVLNSLDNGHKHIMPLFDPSSSLDLNETLSKRDLESDITFHGGRVLTKKVTVYNIFYGKWTSYQAHLINTLTSGLSSSKYFIAEKSYSDKNGKFISGPIKLGGSRIISSSKFGTTLSDTDLPKIIAYAIKSAKWPTKNTSIYVINTSKNIRESSGFCVKYCGFHSTATINKVNHVPIAFIGNPSGSQACMNGCSPYNQKVSPNNNAGIDALASIYSHELMEAISDPDGDAWYDSDGEENADKCAYQYGAVTKLSNGAYYNEIIGGRKWLIQMNWNALTQSCQN